MALFIFFIISAVIALIATGVSFFTPKETSYSRSTTNPRLNVRIGAGSVLLVGLIFLLFSSFTMVGTKNVAVMTVAGRPVGYLDNGFHWKTPWQKPHEISDAVQTDTYASDPEDATKKQGGATDNCVHVRIERQAIACVNVSIRWQIRPQGVDYLYRNYKSNTHIQDNVVLRDLQQALNQAFASYDPLGVDADGKNTNPQLTVYAGQVLRQLSGKDGHSGEIGQWIDVQSVILPLLSYDNDTEKKVQQVLQQISLTRVAQQAEQTALAQSKANKALAASVSNDPNVLVSKCLDILKEAVDKGQQLPAGFSCFGNTPPVAVSAK